MPRKLLVVDDSATIQEAVRHSLTGEDWSVVGAENVAEALQRAESEHPDAILCDVSLRDGDGYELCRNLRGRSATAGVPIVLMGAKVSSPTALSAGASTTLPKPFESGELLQTLADTIEQADFDLDLEGFDAEAEEAPPLSLQELEGAITTAPAPTPPGEDEVEIIDLSDDEEFAELELLDDLAPILPAAVDGDLAAEGLRPSTEIPGEPNPPLDVESDAAGETGYEADETSPEEVEFALEDASYDFELSEPLGADALGDLEEVAVPGEGETFAPLGDAGEETPGLEEGEIRVPEEHVAPEGDEESPFASVFGSGEEPGGGGPAEFSLEEAMSFEGPASEPEEAPAPGTPESEGLRPSSDAPGLGGDEGRGLDTALADDEAPLEPVFPPEMDTATSSEEASPDHEGEAEAGLGPWQQELPEEHLVETEPEGARTPEQGEGAERTPETETGETFREPDAAWMELAEAVSEPRQDDISYEPAGGDREDQASPSGLIEGAKDEQLRERAPRDFESAAAESPSEGVGPEAPSRPQRTDEGTLPSLDQVAVAATERALREALSAHLQPQALVPVVEAVVERVVWEVVPDLAESLIQETLRKLQIGPTTEGTGQPPRS